MKPLIYLELRAFVNSINYSVRNPKRLIPIVLIGVWLLASFLPLLMLASGNTEKGLHNPKFISEIPTAAIESGLFLFLSMGAVLTMYQAFKSGLLIFTVSHIDFMFPTPISRRKVLTIKLIKDYFKFGFFVAFFYLFLGSTVFLSIGVHIMPWGLVGIIALASLQILVINVAHTINIVFTFGWERLTRLGIAIKALLVTVPLSALGYGLFNYTHTHNGVQSFKWAAASPLINAVFAPARWCAAFVLAPITHVAKPYGWEYFYALIGLAFASFVVLITRKENIYEPSIGISLKFARSRAAARSGDYLSMRMESLREKKQKRIKGGGIPPFGLGASAFLWKNMVLKLRGSQTQFVIFGIMIALGIISVRFVDQDFHMIKMLPMFFVYAVGGIGMSSQMEMRSELKQANIIKTMPIASWKLIFSQMMSSITLVTLGIWGASALLWIALPSIRGPILISSAIATPFLSFAIIPAALIPAILYPEVRDMVQNYLSSLFGFMFTGIAVGPPIALGVVAVYILKLHLYVGVAIGCFACIIMGLAGLGIASRALRAFDPSTE